MRRDHTINGSVRTRPIHHFSTQDLRNSVSVSRREHLCGWEISQLVLLHDDLGIVEWFNDAERQMFPSANKPELSRAIFGHVTSKTSEVRSQPTQNDMPTINTFSARLHEICLKRNTLNNAEMIPLKTEQRKHENDVQEIPQNFVSSKSVHKNKEGIHNHRSMEGRERHLKGYTKPVLNPILTIRNLERRLAAKRKAKIEKEIEGLRQPLTTTTKWPKRELFNPSIVSIMSDIRAERPRADSQETRQRLYKKYLQLMPTDRTLTLRKRANTVNLPPPKISLTPLPQNPHSKQLQYKTVDSSKEVHNMLKSEFLVQQTKETLVLKESLCKAQEEIEVQQRGVVKTDVGSGPCSTEESTLE